MKKLQAALVAFLMTVGVANLAFASSEKKEEPKKEHKDEHKENKESKEHKDDHHKPEPKKH